MKKNILISVLSILSLVEGAWALSLSDAQKVVQANRAQVVKDCSSENLKLQNNLIKNNSSLTKEEKAVCRLEVKKTFNDWCRLQMSLIKELAQIVDEKNIRSTAQRMGGAPDDAMSALINWKVDRAIDQFDVRLNEWVVKRKDKEICKITRMRGDTSDYVGSVNQRIKNNIRKPLEDIKIELNNTKQAEVITEPRSEALELELHAAGVQ